MAGRIRLPGSMFATGWIVLLITKTVCAYPHGEFELRELTSSLSSLQSSVNEDDLFTLNERVVEKSELLVIDRLRKDVDASWKKKEVRRDTSEHGKVPSTNASAGSFVDPSKEQRSYDQRQSSVAVGTARSDSKIVFPTEDALTVSQVHRFSLGPVPVCKGTTFCERTTYYPEDVVNAAIERNHSITFLASVDMVPPRDDLAQRIDAPNDTPLCVSTEQLIYPKTAENNQKEWLFVVNQENFKQGVRIETCSNENGDCNVIDGLAAGYKTSCKQKYVYRQLAAVSESGTINPEMFRFPSSCCCHVKFTGNPLARMGITIGNENSQTVRNKGRRSRE